MLNYHDGHTTMAYFLIHIHDFPLRGMMADSREDLEKNFEV